MLQKIKEQSNLEAKLGALKEMISEGWLTHIQQHPTLLQPDWPFRDQIAGEDWIFAKAHQIIIPTTLQKYIFTFFWVKMQSDYLCVNLHVKHKK